MRPVTLPFGALWLLLMVPAAASAQSSIAGNVRDASGAILPGVAVEASSPALIERARTVVTDEQGRYAIVDLRPGLVQGHLHASGLHDVRPGRDRSAGELHGDRERRSARSAPSRNR